MDDEEALKWAAVERLPTYDRVRTSVFYDKATGGVKQVDVRQMSPLETTELLDKLMAEAQDENNLFLLKMRKRLDKYASCPSFHAQFSCILRSGIAFQG